MFCGKFKCFSTYVSVWSCFLLDCYSSCLIRAPLRFSVVSHFSSPLLLLAALGTLFSWASHISFPTRCLPKVGPSSSPIWSSILQFVRTTNSKNLIMLPFASNPPESSVLKLKRALRSGLCLPPVSFNHVCAAVFFLQTGHLSHGDSTGFHSELWLVGCMCVRWGRRLPCSLTSCLCMSCFSAWNFSAIFNPPKWTLLLFRSPLFSGSLSWLPKFKGSSVCFNFFFNISRFYCHIIKQNMML